MSMATSSNTQRAKKETKRGTWMVEEDQKLAQVIEIHGPTKWKSLVVKAGIRLIPIIIIIIIIVFKRKEILNSLQKVNRFFK